MERRAFVIGAALAVVATKHALAQQAVDQPISIESYIARLQAPDGLGRMLIDVAFVQSWRIEIAPRGYENDPEWAKKAISVRFQVFNTNGEAAIKAVRASEQSVLEYDTRAINTYKDSADSFADFLKDIGIDPVGKAAGRILQSLRDYALLSAATLEQGQFEETTEDSFYWPWC